MPFYLSVLPRFASPWRRPKTAIDLTAQDLRESGALGIDLPKTTARDELIVQLAFAIHPVVE